MKTEYKMLITLSILALAVSACSLFKGSKDKEKPNEVLMEKTVRSRSGGFEFQPLEGYKVAEAAGIASMFLPGGDEQSGPGMILSGLIFDQAVSLELAEAVIVKTYPAYTFDKSKPIQVDKIKGLSLEFSSTYHAPDGIILEKPGADEGEEIQGRIIVVMLNPTQQFRCILLAPADQWKDMRHKFDKVLDSVHLFEIQP